MGSALHPGGDEGGSPLRQEGFGRLGRGHGAPRGRLQAPVGAIGEAAVALQGRHVAAGAGRVLGQTKVAELALPAGHVEGVGGKVEGGRGAGRRQEVGGAGWGWGPSAGGGGGRAGTSP